MKNHCWSRTLHSARDVIRCHAEHDSFPRLISGIITAMRYGHLYVIITARLRVFIHCHKNVNYHIYAYVMSIYFHTEYVKGRGT